MTTTTDTTIRVLFADDHAVVREGLRALIDSEPMMEVAGEASNGEEAVHLAALVQPDVILLDLKMAPMDGIETIKALKEQELPARIMVLTSFAGNDEVFAAIKAGALGYLLKDSTPEELLKAIHEVHRGEPSLHPTIAGRLVQELNKPSKLPPSTDPLSEREVEVLQLVAQGYTNQEIGDQLFISVRTVGNHVSAILTKLHLANRTQAALFALREGLATLDPPGA
jgi:NarL family two-component system response regulator LiaR